VRCLVVVSEDSQICTDCMIHGTHRTRTDCMIQQTGSMQKRGGYHIVIVIHKHILLLFLQTNVL
jgi:hypothetical protein